MRRQPSVLPGTWRAAARPAPDLPHGKAHSHLPKVRRGTLLEKTAASILSSLRFRFLEAQLSVEYIYVLGAGLEKLLVHFDVPDDYVLLETFVGSARATQLVINAFSREFFDDNLQFELIVFAPEPGSLKQYIGLTIKAVGSAGVFLLGLTQFLDSPSIQQISKEAFGVHATEVAIREVREFRERLAQKAEGEAKEGEITKEAVKLMERAIVNSTKATLQVPRETLEREGISERLAFDLGSAQSELYGATLSDAKVRAVGFEEGEDFPVPRNQFAQRAIRPRPPKEEEPEQEWNVAIVRLRVTSPNFDRDDQQGRRWKAKHTGGGYYLFEIVDEFFWSKISRQEFEFSEGTDIDVQIATKVSGKGPRERKVLRVLNINGEKIAEPLDDLALEAALGTFLKVLGDGEQTDLFD